MIDRLVEIQGEREALHREERSLSSPSMMDYDDVGRVYRFCCQAYGELHPDRHGSGSELRRQAIFVILFLYSPRTLAGGRMNSGLRRRIAEVMGLEPSNVSHYHADVWFYYSVYADFREDIDNLFARVFALLREDQGRGNVGNNSHICTDENREIH